MTPSGSQPLVSCVTTAPAGGATFALAVRSFLRQTYPNRELVVVGPPGAAGLPSDPRIRCVPSAPGRTLTERRAVGWEHGRGHLLAHWDSDAWHAPNRLGRQVAALAHAGADVCGLGVRLLYDPGAEQGWRSAQLAERSLLFTREFLTRRGPPVVGTLDPRRTAVVSDEPLQVEALRGAAEPGWLPYPVADIRQLLGDDWDDFRRATVEPAPPRRAGRVRNVFACLVHESPECVVDLVRNLRHLDPDSAVVLYNGGKNPRLLDGLFLRGRDGVVVHPAPRPLEWGRLHDFAVDCMRFALEHVPFDALTVVDSDQLGLRPGYSDRLAAVLAENPGVGLLGSCPGVQRPGATAAPPAAVAHAEFDLWRPFLRQFPGGESEFVHWTFWPSTVFTAAAAGGLVRMFDEDPLLADLLRKTRVWATEEVILPTLVALLGLRVAANPCGYDYVKFRAAYSAAQIDAALARPDAYWVHPVPRRYDDPVRRQVRDRFGGYVGSPAADDIDDGPPLLLTLPLLARMREVEGWLDDAEADLLIGATARALADAPNADAVVEVGSYCGRATVVLAGVVRAVRPGARVWAIDPHDGRLGTADRVVTVPPSLEKLKANLARASAAGVVEVVRAAAPDVPWDRPIALLLIDGLHDYASVARDFFHLAPWVAAGGLVAFHDYAGYYPGVVAFVDELLADGGYRKVQSAGTLVVLRKTAGQADPVAVRTAVIP